MSGAVLPEAAGVPWRRRVDDDALARAGRLWTLHTASLSVPFLLTAAALLAIEPLTAPMAAIIGAHAWIVPALHARRGAKAVRPSGAPTAEAEHRAIGLLGDLLDHDSRALHAQTGLALEPGRLGTWLVGEAGALLVRPGGRRVHCYCVRVPDRSLPSGDRVAHLLLALRADEQGFATVANLAFAGATWRVRRRLAPHARPALDAARAVAAAVAPA